MAGLLRAGVFSAACFSTVLITGFGWVALTSADQGDSGKAASPEAAARAKLSEKGVHVSHSGLSLVDEKALGHAFNEVNIFKRKLAAASKELQAAQRSIDEMQDNLRQRLRGDVELHSQLATVPRNNIIEHNQLVAAANANASTINLIRQEQEQSKKEIDVVRKKANVARESYVQQIAEIRALVDRLSEKYASLKSDADVRSDLAEWNSAANTSFELKPSSYFLNSVKKLEVLEKSIVSEKIALRREGNSYYATVVINGKQPEEMIVDTGANSVVLPYKVALECGAKPDESSQSVTATVADGSKVKSKLVLLDSVRVGKFMAERVECIVLPPEAKNAPMLLGMTFLSRFNFSINGTDLVLSKIDGDHASAKPKKTRASKSTRKSRKSDDSTEPGR
ncbi:MAG TPA: retropepsin-like aspartic protease [Planctomycetaceae bacterium]|jgi:clan AA aspartic protease (TIGR02281 family)|nr:retropepsin-like aspartic protease [Planctomycetaceae bacterium]